MFLTKISTEWRYFVQYSSYALEFIIVSLYTIGTASSNLKKLFNEKNITTIMTLTL